MDTVVANQSIESTAAFNFPLVAVKEHDVVSTRNNQVFDRYLKEIGQYELLSRDEMELDAELHGSCPGRQHWSFKGCEKI